MKITSAHPSITKKEIKIVYEAIQSGWGPKMSYYIDSFAKKFSEYVGVKYCLPVFAPVTYRTKTLWLTRK